MRPGTPKDGARLRGVPRKWKGVGQDLRVSARRCLSFPSLLPITRCLLAVEGKGKAWGARSGAPKPRGSGSPPPTPPPPTQESPPPPSTAYVPALAILSMPGGGTWGFRTPGSPRGFLQLWQPRPRPGSPAPPRLGAVPAGRACLARRQSPQLSPGCPCSYLAGPPLCAPSSVICASRGAPATPHYPLRGSESGSPMLGGTLCREELRRCTGRETRAETGGSYHLRGGTGKSAESKRPGGGEWRGLARGPRPGTTGRSPSGPTPACSQLPQGQPPRALLPPPPALCRPSVVVRSAAHPLSGTRPPRDSARLASSPAPFPHFLGFGTECPPPLAGYLAAGERLGLREGPAPASPRTDRQTDRWVSVRQAGTGPRQGPRQASGSRSSRC